MTIFKANHIIKLNDNFNKVLYILVVKNRLTKAIKNDLAFELLEEFKTRNKGKGTLKQALQTINNGDYQRNCNLEIKRSEKDFNWCFVSTKSSLHSNLRKNVVIIQA